jgi:hypothetical protein
MRYGAFWTSIFVFLAIDGWLLSLRLQAELSFRTSPSKGLANVWERSWDCI